MSESNSSRIDGAAENAPADAPIQFDHADFENSAAAISRCGVCQNPIVDVYYECGDRMLCPNCPASVRADLKGGSALLRAVKAFVLGSAAALVGAVFYYSFVRMTDWNIGFISILVGLLVGGGVRKGSGNRGGAFYQVMAVALCYLSLVGMHVPFIVEAVVQQAKLNDEEAKKADQELKVAVDKFNAQRAAPKPAAMPKTAAAAEPASGGAVPPTAAVKPPDISAAPGAAPEPGKNAPTQSTGVTAKPEQPVPGELANVDKPAGGPVAANGPTPADHPKEIQPVELVEADADAANPSPMEVVLFFLVLGGLTLTAPIQVAISDPISGLIFALWEAWKINIRPKIVISGPFHLNGGADATSNSGGAVHAG
jgi:hypothetical protein